jgi:aspartate-semialdehyde dehydrogenase
MTSESREGARVAVVGATGAVGREMIKVLEERDFPIASLRLCASSRSAGEELLFRGRTVDVEVLDENSPGDLDLVLFSAGSAVSRRFAPAFAAEGAVVIDNSSAWRMDPEVPLVVPEVNPEAIAQATDPGGRRIIANPNCSTIQMVVALAPLAHAFGLERVVVSTYQSVSGAGQKGIDELSAQVLGMFNQKESPVAAFPHRVAFNCIPAIGAFREDGYSEEEWKLVEESRKILGLPDLKVTPTAVRVPTFACHGESILAVLGKPVTVAMVRRELAVADGVVVQDDPSDNVYPMGLDLAGSDDVFVGRIRRDPYDDHSVAMWVVADNLRKGAAVNAVQIAEVVWGARA